MADKDNTIDDLVGEVALSDMPKTARNMPNPIGRPPMYSDVKELQNKIDMYFEHHIAPKEEQIEDKDGNVKTLLRPGKPPTVAGLALYLGFADYRVIYRGPYKERPEFNHAIKSAIARIAEYAQEQLFIGQSTGAIFWLKNHGWADKVESEVYGKDGGAIETKDVSDKDRGILKHFINNYKERAK